jgi:hypothetical protein
LERRIKEYEEESPSRDLSRQTTMQMLQSENAAMKRLLDALGVNQSLLGEYLKDSPDTQTGGLENGKSKSKSNVQFPVSLLTVKEYNSEC